MSRRISPGEAVYPAGLLDLEDSPPVHIRGELSAVPAVAVVGTRRCTSYGVRLAEAFGLAIARAGWSVVSGLARGIDAAAHRGCLSGGGHAVAILGSGIDVCYPKENKPILDQILDTAGLVVSEYPGETPPDRWRFPARNRLIAAWSQAVVVVEAAATGGALITARLAAELGRPVFAVPGDVDRGASAGCNLLIRDGAFPTFGADDLIEELSLIVGPPASRARSDGSIPPAGAEIEALVDIWGIPLSEVLARIGRMEIDGSLTRSGNRVIPSTTESRQ